MNDILKKYYQLDEETKEVLPLLHIYQELKSAIDDFPNIKIENMDDEEILMQTIIKCWDSTDLKATDIVDKLLSILNCQNITVKDLKNIELNELLNLILDDISDDKKSKDLDVLKDEKNILKFTCRGYQCLFFKEQNKYFLILINGEDANILKFNSVEKILSDSIEKFLLEQKLYGKPIKKAYN